MKQHNLGKRTVGVFLAASLVFCSLFLNGTAGSGILTGQIQAAAADSETSGDNLGYAEGEILIVYQDNVSEKQIGDAIENQDGEFIETVAELEEETVALVSISDDMTVEEAVEAYSSDPAVAYAEPNYIMRVYDGEDTTDSESTSEQWYLDYVYAQDAWDVLADMSGETVRVALIDTGADITHEDLANVINTDLSVEIVRTERGPGNYYYSTQALRGDGYLNGTGRINSSTIHGTHVAGIIAAEAGNSAGIQGTASGGTTAAGNQIVDLVVIDAFTMMDSSGEDSAAVSDVIYAMQYAADNGCQVINLSMGTENESATLESMCEQLYEEGISIVCAAGNSYSTQAIYLSDYTSTISVINITSDGSRNASSNYGSAKDISAPGTSIYSTLNGGGYTYLTGTSMAAPIVTSAAAMMLYVNPNLAPSAVKSILCETATDLSDAGKDDETGYGAVNILAAAETAIDLADDASGTEEDEADGTDDASGSDGDETDGTDDASGTEEDGSDGTGEASAADSLVVRRGNVYYFIYSLASGNADIRLTYGRTGDEVYIGDWDGDGIDTLCIRRGNLYHFKNSLTGGNADIVISYGRSTDTVLVGDWDGDGVDTL
ncbi:MAG: S8 family serine peptidase, partial [Lachnospiraceae bacterium]|nr:S8 family serine peptidase [Lachnospiraceae bacterium]